MLLNLAVVTLFATNLGIRILKKDVSFLPLLLSSIAVLLLAISGHLGGKLVFDNGISVGRHRRKTALPEKTRTFEAATAGAVDKHVKVATVAELADGGTLRVQIGATVFVVARANDKFFAFQEFCTHRFGPLSEGCIVGEQIECPWHRSRFDMKTGEVTHGPAKTPLRHFDVIVRNGEILVAIDPLPQPS